MSAVTEEEAAEIESSDVKGISLFFSSLWAWFKGLFSRGDE